MYARAKPHYFRMMTLSPLYERHTSRCFFPSRWVDVTWLNFGSQHPYYPLRRSWLPDMHKMHWLSQSLTTRWVWWVWTRSYVKQSTWQLKQLFSRKLAPTQRELSTPHATLVLYVHESELFSLLAEFLHVYKIIVLIFKFEHHIVVNTIRYTAYTGYII